MLSTQLSTGGNFVNLSCLLIHPPVGNFVGNLWTTTQVVNAVPFAAYLSRPAPTIRLASVTGVSPAHMRPNLIRRRDGFLARSALTFLRV